MTTDDEQFDEEEEGEREEEEEDNRPLPLPKRRRPGQRMNLIERKHTQNAFLKALANTANERAACLQTGIDTKLPYIWAKSDPEFAERFKEANEQANWLLFGEAWRRAMQGEEEFVVSLGKLIYGPDGKPLTVRKKSDRLLELLLKARLPEFRDKGTTIVTILPKEYINLPDDGIVE